MANASNEREIKKAELREKERQKKERDDIKVVLSTVSGRRFMWRLLEKCKVFNSIFDENALWMAKRSGKQDVGHFIMSEIIKADENLYIKMMRANQKGERNE